MGKYNFWLGISIVPLVGDPRELYAQFEWQSNDFHHGVEQLHLTAQPDRQPMNQCDMKHVETCREVPRGARVLVERALRWLRAFLCACKRGFVYLWMHLCATHRSSFCITVLAGPSSIYGCTFVPLTEVASASQCWQAHRLSWDPGHCRGHNSTRA